MVRSGRVKYYYFPGSPDLYPGTDGTVDAYSDNSINGRIQAVYYEYGNWPEGGSVFVSISGIPLTAGTILGMTSGPSTGPGAGSAIGHHLGEDWVVFPRATTVHTDAIQISGPNGYDEFAEIPAWSTIRIQAGSIGAGSHASGISIVYI